MMKRLTKIFLAIVLTLTITTGCSGQHFRFDDDTSWTRGKWIEELAITFGMNEYEEDQPYYSDVQSSNPIFSYVQSCYEWDVLRDVSGKFAEEDGATLEFVVTTAVYAAGVDLNEYDGKSDAEKALNFAKKNQISKANADYNSWATQEQCENILAAAQQAYFEQGLEPIENIEYKEGVIDESDSDRIQLSKGNQYIFKDLKPVVDGVYIAPGTKDNPEGVVIKVSKITDNGDNTYTVDTTTPDLSEVFEELEYQNVLVPDYEDIQAADGVKISGMSSNTGVVSSLTDDETTSVPTASLAMVGSAKIVKSDKPIYTADLGPLAKSKAKGGLSFDAEINFTKGTVGINQKWESNFLSLSNSIQNSGSSIDPASFEKTSIIPDKVLFGPDPYTNEKAIQDYQDGKISVDELRSQLQKYQNEDGTEKRNPTMTNKFSGGYEVVGKISVKNLYVVPSLKLDTLKIFGKDTHIPTGIEKFSIETNYGSSISGSIKGKLENELTICTIPITINGVGTVDLALSVYFEANGELSLDISINNNTKTEYNDGKIKKTTTKDSSAKMEAEIDIETGPKLSATLKVLSVPIVNADVSCAVKATASASIELSNEWTETDDAFVIDRKTTLNRKVKGYIPIVKISIGTKQNTLAYKIKVKYTFDIVGTPSSNALMTAKSFDFLPEEELVLWEQHLELPKDTENEIQSEEQENNMNDENKEEERLGSNMNISSYYIHVPLGKTEKVEIEYPKGYNAEDFIWTTSDKQIATVNNGTVKAVKKGNTIVSAKSKDGKYYANCAVYVGDDDNVKFEGLK